jgi:hypothetical protein
MLMNLYKYFQVVISTIGEISYIVSSFKFMRCLVPRHDVASLFYINYLYSLLIA